MKAMLKWLIRQFVYARLAWFPLSEASAMYWVEFMKRWPAFFAEHPFVRQVRLVDGQQMTVGMIDVIERNLFLHGTWDQPVLEALQRELKPGHTFVDIGANIGYFTLIASRLVGPSGKVLALEPSHINLAKLAQHTWSNDAGNVLIASVAAGRDYALPLLNFPTPNNAGAASLRPLSSIRSSLVLQMPLDDLIEAHGLQPDLIKLDVEGFELEALRGLERTLAAFGPVVVCELTDAFLRELGQDSRQLLAHMESFGYTCTVLDAGGAQAVHRLRSDDASIPDNQIDVVFRREAVGT